ncbi:hypothetical protein PINS_up011852 [Pythium insidiosum]|nr:hypothetical protein PINS_up011852 [Pythium insidiosum]
MPREVYFQLIDEATRLPLPRTSADAVLLPDGASLIRFRDAVFAKVSRALPANVIAANLRVYANQTAFELKNAPLQVRDKIGADLGKNEDIYVVVPTQQQPSGVAVESTPVQWESLLNMLEWKEPRRLCASVGQDWPYQGAPQLVDRLATPLEHHYNAWQIGNQDKQNHAINLVLSGAGTGKSRMLDEMKDLLCRAATRSKNQALMDRMESAYVFRVTFENGTAATGSLLDPKNPDYDISYRMLYQLAKDRIPWLAFADRLSDMYSTLRLRIDTVIEILAKLRTISNAEDMTVILCVDGLQKLVNDGTKNCDFYRVLTSICSFLNSSTAFAVCVCSATVHMPIGQALAASPQKRVFLTPPPLRGDEVVVTRTRIEKQLVDDMGGHGRALEALQLALSKYTKEELEEIDPGYIVDQVYGALKSQYGDVFAFPVLGDENNCKEVLAAILSRRSYSVIDTIGRTTLTVDEICSFGLFRLGDEGQLECAFILLVALMRKLVKKRGEVDNFNEQLTHSFLVWQRFEQLVAIYRKVKAIAYCDTRVKLSEFHAGARFGAIDDIAITEPSSRTVVEAIHQDVTQSSIVGDDSACCTNRDGGVSVSDMNTIVINGAGAPAGDILMRVQLTVGGQQVQSNEVIQCKLLQSGDKVNETSYASYVIEKKKAVNKSSDVFLLVTPAEATEFGLPPRCGIVSANEFGRYFGPFASRAYRIVQEPPNINTASYHELCRIEGVGVATATKIITERKKRLFSSLDDAVIRLCASKRCKTAQVLSAMHCDDVGTDV